MGSRALCFLVSYFFPLVLTFAYLLSTKTISIIWRIQAMMKDQFANYVVQKVLETCDDQHRELILSRIKVHLNALKKYTYGKHIVARVEKLVAAGGTSNLYILNLPISTFVTTQICRKHIFILGILLAF